MAAVSAPGRAGGISATAGIDESELHEATARLAYELYEKRHRADGHALEDWLAAEATLREELAARPPALTGE